MKLTFLGTRGYIDSCSPEHRRHSSLLLSYRSRRVMIDCGEDWLGRLDSVSPNAILITHAHPDHAFGLKDGAGCPVYATRECWEGLEGFPIAERREIRAREPFDIGAIRIEAFAVIHSIRAPAVGYRIEAGRRRIFYVPDVIDIDSRTKALSGIDHYIGDGASLTRPLVRRWEGRIFGHTTVRAQLGWCRETGVRRAIFTHCGKQIVEGDRPRWRLRFASWAATGASRRPSPSMGFRSGSDDRGGCPKGNLRCSPWSVVPYDTMFWGTPQAGQSFHRGSLGPENAGQPGMNIRRMASLE